MTSSVGAVDRVKARTIGVIVLGMNDCFACRRIVGG